MEHKDRRFPFGFDWSIDLDPAPILRGPVGDLLARPWLDQVSLTSIGRYLIPTSRLWAAAELAGEDVDAFVRATRLNDVRAPGKSMLRRALGLTARMHRRYDKAEARWRDAFFAGRPVDPDVLRAVQRGRVRRARDWMACRGLFLPFIGAKGFQGVVWDVPSPQEMADRFGARLARPGGLYALPDPLPRVVESAGFEAGGRRHSWIRLDHADGTRGWARVTGPADGVPARTVVSCHGLAVESEMWNSSFGDAAAFLDPDIRVIQPEAPFHSRNRLAGRWGGEPFIGTLPAGAIELFSRAFPELAALTAWARATGSQAVGLGGVSMGALTVQRAAVEAAAWPAECRPDALFLTATSEDLLEVATEGALGRMFGIAHAFRQAGWSTEALARWSVQVDPEGDPALDPARIVLALGSTDDVTPFDGGLELARRWGVPEANLFVRDVGHFTSPMSLYRDPTPTRRFQTVLAGAP